MCHIEPHSTALCRRLRVYLVVLSAHQTSVEQQHTAPLLNLFLLRCYCACCCCCRLLSCGCSFILLLSLLSSLTPA